MCFGGGGGSAKCPEPGWVLWHHWDGGGDWGCCAVLVVGEPVFCHNLVKRPWALVWKAVVVHKITFVGYE